MGEASWEKQLGEIVSSNALPAKVETPKPVVADEHHKKVAALRKKLRNCEMNTLVSTAFGPDPSEPHYEEIDTERAEKLTEKIMELFNEDRTPIHLRWVVLGAGLALQERWCKKQLGEIQMREMYNAHKRYEMKAKLLDMIEHVGEDNVIGEGPNGERITGKELVDKIDKMLGAMDGGHHPGCDGNCGGHEELEDESD